METRNYRNPWNRGAPVIADQFSSGQAFGASRPAPVEGACPSFSTHDAIAFALVLAMVCTSTHPAELVDRFSTQEIATMSTFRTESADAPAAKTRGSKSAAQARQDMIEADRNPPSAPLPAVAAAARADASAPKTLSAAAAREAMVQRNFKE